MMIRKTWAGAAAGDPVGVGLAIIVGFGRGVCVAVAWAADLGAQAARRQAEIPMATSRILLEPTIHAP